MTRLFIARHGETEGVLAGRMEARKDSPLTETGIKQASALERALRTIRFVRVCSSPSPRALRTASIAKGDRTDDIEPDERLYELDIGDWDGKTREEIIRADPELFDRFSNHPELYRPARGESFEDLQKRVAAFMGSFQRAAAEEAVLIVTHSSVVKMMLDWAEAKPLSEFRNRRIIPNGSLSVIRIGMQKAAIELEADIRHLQEAVTVHALPEEAVP